MKNSAIYDFSHGQQDLVLTNLFDRTYEAVAILHNSKIVYCNNYFSKVLGHSQIELTFRKLDDFVHPDDLAEFQKTLNRHHSGQGLKTRLSFRAFSLSGASIWLDSSCVPVLWNGQAACLYFFHDVSSQKRTESMLDSSIIQRKKDQASLVLKESRYKNLLGALPDIIFLLDDNGKFIDFFGKEHPLIAEQAFFLGRTVHQVLPTEIAEIAMTQIETISITGATPPFFYEIPLGNELKHYESRMAPCGPKHYLAIIRDITDIKNAEEELITAREEAESANRTKSEFLVGVLQQMQLTTQQTLNRLAALEKEIVGPEQARHVTSAMITAQSLVSVFSNLLDLSLAESGMLELDEATFTFSEIYDNIYHQLRNIAQKKDLIIESSIDESIPDQLVGDAERIQQILYNLLHNAVHFTETGSVSVEIFPVFESENGIAHILFSITDTGIGISEEVQYDLLKPFMLSENYQNSEGAGLGLSLAASLVEVMNGSICLESSPGVGTAVYVILPLREDY
ncbi:PAS domain-containing sensor histidine kinase [Desulfonatronovibrio magnus]|uniref:PAS domain-containing sensor histidine kinase n=1 Tax=Desulfonatronovibrio magnus TaxID=698827 RepID=UPI0005EAD190|nr:PAS domain-containing sensor histidine kinase [Desulfonatronovibrio magnus]